MCFLFCKWTAKAQRDVSKVMNLSCSRKLPASPLLGYLSPSLQFVIQFRALMHMVSLKLLACSLSYISLVNISFSPCFQSNFYHILLWCFMYGHTHPCWMVRSSYPLTSNGCLFPAFPCIPGLPLTFPPWLSPWYMVCLKLAMQNKYCSRSFEYTDNFNGRIFLFFQLFPICFQIV